MIALCITKNSLQVGMLRGVHGTKRLMLRLADRWTSRRNYQLPVAVFEGEMKLKKKDNVSVDSEMIYRMSTLKRFRMSAVIVNVKMTMMPTVLGIIYCERHGVLSFRSDALLDLLSQNMLFLTEIQCYGLGSLGILLGMILNRYICLHPIRIYLDKNSSNFVAIYMNSFFPWRIEKHEFTTVKPSFKSIILGERRALVRDDFFKTPAHRYLLCQNSNVS